MKIIGIVGSKRKKGNTAALMEEALHAARNEGIETEMVYLGDYDIKGCTGCEGCRETYTCIIKDGMQELYPKIIEADGLIAGSPTYFYNMTADMKAFIERLYCYEVFDASDRSVWMSVNEAIGSKLAATIAICEQHHVKDMGVTFKQGIRRMYKMKRLSLGSAIGVEIGIGTAIGVAVNNIPIGVAVELL